jgi:hypothetical protein
MVNIEDQLRVTFRPLIGPSLTLWRIPTNRLVDAAADRVSRGWKNALFDTSLRVAKIGLIQKQPAQGRLRQILLCRF